MSNVLVIDDEPAICWSVSEVLTDRGHQVKAVSSLQQAWKQLSVFSPDLVVLDVRLPGEDGLSALPQFASRLPQVPVIVITAFGDLATAVTALGRGAFDYLVKPFDLENFAQTAESALARRASPRFSTAGAVEAEAFIGVGPAMQAVFRQIALVAPTEFPVLLLGETGAGKEVAARAIHRHSSRAHGPFVPVCPAALNPQLIESELFGHVAGAFTGAASDRPGLFELARNGTLFLDEIADTPMAVQVKLLRALESGRFCRVGSGEERATNARLIAATHRSLTSLIAAGTFREDLYHRLKVFSIVLPPLRERREDVAPLVEYFLSRQERSLAPAAATPDFWNAVKSRDWRGNVRELRHAIDHAVVVARGGSLRAEHLPPEEAARDAGSGNGQASAEVELMNAAVRWVRGLIERGDGFAPNNLRQQLLEIVEPAVIAEVVRANANNLTAAAKALGCDRATLRSRLRQASQREDGD